MSKIKRGLLFVVILTVLLTAGSAGIECYVINQLDGKVTGRNRPFAALTVETRDTLDLLVAGDSESYNSVSTMQLWKEHGITAYDCGQGAQRIPETYYMLKQAFKRQSPKVVILETNTLFRDIGTVKTVQAILEQVGQYYIPIFRYHNLWKTLFDQPEKTMNYKGFVIRKEVNAYDGRPDYMEKKKKCETMPQYVKFYLKKIESLCEKNGAQLVLVSMPSPKNWNQKRHEEIKNYADENKMAYLDLNHKTEELGLNWLEDTQDKGDHLNIYGAEKVTAYLGKYLEENYKMEDHRKEASYVAWNQLAEQYDQDLEQIQAGQIQAEQTQTEQTQAERIQDKKIEQEQ